MFKNEIVNVLVSLQKKGVGIYLTDEGYRVFLKMMQDGLKEDITEMQEKAI